MSKDINSLSGIEFENLCQALLQKAGFIVETTKVSGDGGIDLIAFSDSVFYSGKYIIQCKRYAGSVGEPVVRDLYGVVMAERANKGILITTGHFTISAARFSKDKNIELIDGEKLAQLLSKYELVKDDKLSQYNHFTQHECFDKRKYEFYKSRVSSNECSLEMGRDFLFDFMFGYIKLAGKNKKNNAMLQAGFAEEYLKLFDWYVGKYYKKGKDNQSMLSLYTRKYRALAQLLNYDLFAYVQDRYDILTSVCEVEIDLKAEPDLDEGTLKIINKGGKGARAVMKDLLESERVQISFPKQCDNFYELMNLLGLFSYFKIELGVRVINKALFGRYPHFEPWVITQKDYQCAIENAKIFYRFADDYWSDKRSSVNLTSYYDQSSDHHKEKIQDEIVKIENMINALL